MPAPYARPSTQDAEVLWLSGSGSALLFGVGRMVIADWMGKTGVLCMMCLLTEFFSPI